MHLKLEDQKYWEVVTFPNNIPTWPAGGASAALSLLLPLIQASLWRQTLSDKLQTRWDAPTQPGG